MKWQFLLCLAILLLSTFGFCKEDRKTQGVEYITLKNGYRVWTQRVGDGPIQILTLHGGPGLTHEYFECMENFFPKDKYQIIYYDQLGSHFSDQPNDPSLWNVERFCEEVEEVREALQLNDLYLYGQSWGALLSTEYSIKHPEHLKGVILSNITGSVESYVTYLNELRSKLPQDIQDQLKSYENVYDFTNPAYEKIMLEEIYALYLCKITPWPEPLMRSFSKINMQVYQTVQGPNEFVVTGNFKDWNRWNDLHSILTPTLIICGRNDTMSVKDNEKMHSLIPNSRLKICENGTHCAMYDDQENYFDALITFIQDVENNNISK
ncbi:MAG: proline iminopeptidase-family hydrolase [Parachlamydiales bacterium]|nr:proline iminopeptidase-family hydrolase [Parachlamydiales bacterium]